MLENSALLAQQARDAGCLVVHAPIEFSAGYKEIDAEPYGILANVKAGEAFVKGSWGAQLCESMQPDDADIVVEGKRGLCGFASTNLDFVLRKRGIENIALAGFLANCCVESTMRAAYERGYKVYTLTDCVAATSEEEQTACTTFTYPMFSVVSTSKSFMEELA